MRLQGPGELQRSPELQVFQKSLQELEMQELQKHLEALKLQRLQKRLRQELSCSSSAFSSHSPAVS